MRYLEGEEVISPDTLVCDSKHTTWYLPSSSIKQLMVPLRSYGILSYEYIMITMAVEKINSG